MQDIVSHKYLTDSVHLQLSVNLYSSVHKMAHKVGEQLYASTSLIAENMEAASNILHLSLRLAKDGHC